MQLLHAIRPTEMQRTALARIIAAPTPTVAGNELTKSSNLVAARNMLASLGFVEYDETTANLTDKGWQLAQDENIVDDNRQLTPEGEKLGFVTPPA